MLGRMLLREGLHVGRPHLGALIQRMSIQAITLQAHRVREVLEPSLACFGPPEVVDTARPLNSLPDGTLDQISIFWGRASSSVKISIGEGIKFEESPIDQQCTF